MSRGVKPRLRTNCTAESTTEGTTAFERAGVGGVVAGTPVVVDTGTAVVVDAVLFGFDDVEVTGDRDVGDAILAAVLSDVDVTDRTDVDDPFEAFVELHPHATTTAIHADATYLADRAGNRFRLASNMQFDRTVNALIQRIAPKRRANLAFRRRQPGAPAVSTDGRDLGRGVRSRASHVLTCEGAGPLGGFDDLDVVPGLRAGHHTRTTQLPDQELPPHHSPASRNQ